MLSFPQNRNQYHLTHKIGAGQLSEIYMARCITNDNVVTIKIYNLEDQKFRNFKNILQTIKNNSSFWFNEFHQNLIHYYGSFFTDNKLWTISEFMDCGCCADALHQLYPNGIDDEILISSILKPVLLFLNYLHKDNKVYGYVSPKNILFSTQGNVKMNLILHPLIHSSDSYTPPEIKESVDQSSSTKNKKSSDIPLWAKVIKDKKSLSSPKEQKKANYTDKIDIYDIGITAITLAIGKNPGNDVIDLIRTKATLPNRSNFSSSFFDFVNSCIKSNATKRPTIEQLLQHKFIKNAQDQNYLQAMLTSLLLPMNQRCKAPASNEKPTEEIIYLDPKKASNCLFNLEGNTRNDVQTKKLSDDSKIRLITKTIGRITLLGPEENLDVYNK